MRLTKTDMARVVVQALYNLPQLPKADDFRVARVAKHEGLAALVRQHKIAVKILLDRVA